MVVHVQIQRVENLPLHAPVMTNTKEQLVKVSLQVSNKTKSLNVPKVQAIKLFATEHDI